jgi:hypothetical protein
MRLEVFPVTQKHALLHAQSGILEVAFGVDNSDLQQRLRRKTLFDLVRLIEELFVFSGNVILREFLRGKIDISDKNGDLIGYRSIQLFGAQFGLGDRFRPQLISCIPYLPPVESAGGKGQQDHQKCDLSDA